MLIFFNDIPFRLVSKKDKPTPDHFQVKLNALKDEIVPERLIHHVLITGAQNSHIDQVLGLLEDHLFHHATSITMVVDQYKKAKMHLKSRYKIMKAAGGVVRKNDKILMIYRLKKWDLPKGKMGKNEKPRECALREVEEECNIKVEIVEKIGVTWHTYSLHGRKILKKTTWFAMNCLDDKKMKPQTNEDIEEVRWLMRKDLFHALKDSYESIVHVIRKYRKSIDHL